jgi:opacity protein-like surface antigen
VENPASKDFGRCRRLPRLYWIAVIVLAAGPLFADEGGNDTGEFSAFTGMALGGTDAHPTVGSSAGISLSRYTMALLEASVIPLGRATLLPRGPIKIRGSDLFDFNFALQSRVGVERWEPYGVLGTAVLMNSYRGEIPGASAAVAYQGNRHSKFGLEGGAGVRYYVAERWGIRVEYRYTSSAINFNRILGGVSNQLQMTPSRFGTAPDVIGGNSLCY